MDPSDRSGKPEPAPGTVGRQLTTGRPAAGPGSPDAPGQGGEEEGVAGWLVDDSLLRAMGLGVGEESEGEERALLQTPSPYGGQFEVVAGADFETGYQALYSDEGRWLPDEPKHSPFATLDEGGHAVPAPLAAPVDPFAPLGASSEAGPPSPPGASPSVRAASPPSPSPPASSSPSTAGQDAFARSSPAIAMSPPPGLAAASASPLDELPAALVDRRVREAERVVAALEAQGDDPGTGAGAGAGGDDPRDEPDDLRPEPAHAQSQSRAFSLARSPARPGARSALAALAAVVSDAAIGRGLDEETLFALLARVSPVEMLALHGAAGAPLLAALLEEFEPAPLRDRFFARSAYQLHPVAPLRAFALLRGPRLRHRLAFLSADERRVLCDAVLATAAEDLDDPAEPAGVDPTEPSGDGALLREAFTLRWGLSLPATAPPWPLAALLRFHRELLRIPAPTPPSPSASPSSTSSSSVAAHPVEEPPPPPPAVAVCLDFATPSLRWLSGAIRHELAHAVAATVDVSAFTEGLAGWRTGAGLDVWTDHLADPWLPADRRPLTQAEREDLETAVLDHVQHRKGTLTALPPSHVVRRTWTRGVPVVIAAERCLKHADGSAPHPDALFAASGRRFAISHWHRRFQVCDEAVVADRFDDPPLSSPEEHFADVYTAFYEDQGLVPDAELGHRLRNPAWREWFFTHIHDRGHGPTDGGEGR